MTTKSLVKLSAAIEALTGVALILTPSLVATLLLGVGLDRSGIAIARLTGIALLCFSLACWPGDHVNGNAVFALLSYNVLAAVYLAYLRVGGGFVGGLLFWPALAIHLLLSLLLARATFRQGLPERAKN
jgi:hypothetical protein